MANTMLLMVQTARRRYLVRQGDVHGIRATTSDMLTNSDTYVGVDLGALFDPADTSERSRHHGLFVPLRRKQVVFLVDHVDEVEVPQAPVELPSLLRSQLVQPWALGTLALHDELVVVIDLRAVARSVLSKSLMLG